MSVAAYVFDVAGLAFVGAAIYVGVTHGVVTPDFEVFMTAAAAYLGLKAPTTSITNPVKVAA